MVIKSIFPCSRKMCRFSVSLFLSIQVFYCLSLFNLWFKWGNILTLLWSSFLHFMGLTLLNLYLQISKWSVLHSFMKNKHIRKAAEHGIDHLIDKEVIKIRHRSIKFIVVLMMLFALYFIFFGKMISKSEKML